MKSKIILIILLITPAWVCADTMLWHVRNHTNQEFLAGGYTMGRCFIPTQKIPAQHNHQPGLNKERIRLSGTLQTNGKVFLRSMDGSRELVVSDLQENIGCCNSWRVEVREGKMVKSACVKPKWFRYSWVDVDIYLHDVAISQAR